MDAGREVRAFSHSEIARIPRITRDLRLRDSRCQLRYLLILISVVLFSRWGTGVQASNSELDINVVLIVVDDLGYADMSCTGLASDVETPNMDALASQGIRFTNAYATAPICNAARISLMTGCYQQRQGQYWYSGPGLHDPDYPTLAEVLRKGGYVTGHIGKFHHGSSDGPDGHGFPLNHGFDYLYGFSGGTKHYLNHKKAYHKDDDMLHEGPLWVNRNQDDVDGFTTELFGDEARTFIAKHKEGKFYLHLSFNAVHNFTHQLPEDYLEEKGIEAFPDWNRSKETYWEWRSRIGYPEHPNGRDYYLGQLFYLDREIGLVVQELEAQGIRDRTVIALVSDNGGSLVTYANNGILKGGKYTLFEGGTRVPMILSFPEALQSDVVLDSQVSSMDLFPTICKLTNTAIPTGLDGVDLTPQLILGSKVEPKLRPFFWDTRHEEAVRFGKWKLLVTHSVPNVRLQITDTPVGSFLYDLDNDPGESTNLISQYPEVHERLTGLLKTWQETH